MPRLIDGDVKAPGDGAAKLPGAATVHFQCERFPRSAQITGKEQNIFHIQPASRMEKK